MKYIHTHVTRVHLFSVAVAVSSETKYYSLFPNKMKYGYECSEKLLQNFQYARST